VAGAYLLILTGWRKPFIDSSWVGNLGPYLKKGELCMNNKQEFIEDFCTLGFELPS